MKIINKLKCKFNYHDYKKIEDNATIFQCSFCKKFKYGIAIDRDGLEIYVFPDGSYIKGTPINENNI
jgi:hypothetical protein